MLSKRLLVCALILLIPCVAVAQVPLKAGMTPGQYLLGSDVLTIQADGTITLSKAPLTLAQLGVAPTPSPTPGPGPAPVLNARAQAVLDAVKAISDPDKARNAAGFAAVLAETKKMLVSSNVGDASIIGMTLQFALQRTVAALPAAIQKSWQTVADLIGKQFTEQQKTNSDAVLTVFDDAVAGLSAASPSGILELPYVVDPKTGKSKTDADGKPLDNPRYSPTVAADKGAFDWAKLLEVLLPLILQILSMFMS